MKKFLILCATAAALSLFAMSAPADAASSKASDATAGQAVQMDLSARYYHRHYYYHRPYYRHYYGYYRPYRYYYRPRYYYPYPYYYRPYYYPYGYYPYYYRRPGIYFGFGW